MRATGIAEGQIPANPGAGLGHAGIGPQVDLLIFDAPLQTLDEDVVAPSPLVIHADFDLTGGQYLDEVGRGELAALIGVEYLGRAVFRQRLLDSFHAKISLPRD
jgi:hypothetical protein